MTQVKPKTLVSQFNESIAISLVVVTLIVSGWMTYENYRQLLADRMLVRHTNQVLMTIEQVEAAIIDAETSQRGYIITGETPYLKPYRKAVAAVDQYLDEFQHLVQDNPAQRQRTNKLRELVTAKLDELAHALKIRRDAGTDAAITAVKRGVGNRTMDHIRAEMKRIRKSETELLQARELTADQSYRVGVTSTLLTTTLGLILLGGVLYLIQYNRRRAARAARILREAALERETYFRTLADASPAMIWITDADHQCIFLSQNWYETTGQSQEEGMGVGWTDAVHPDDREQAYQLFETATTAQKSFSFEYRLRMPDGNYRWAMDVGRPRFNSDGQFIGYIGNVIDMHEKHLAQESMRLSESRLRLAAESTGFGTYDYDSRDGRSVWSEQLYRIVDIPVGTPIDQDVVRSIIYPKDLARFDHRMHDALASDAPEDYQAEFRIVRPDGEVRWVADSGRVLSDTPNAGAPKLRAVGTILDITDQKNFEQSLKLAKKSAEAANRSRGEFLANMSHEIRTPMAAILGHADILNEHLKDPDNQLIVETIRRNGKFLLDIINDILDLSKIDAGKLEVETERVRPDGLIAEVRSLMDVRATEKNLSLKIAFDGLVPELIETDAIRLRQILLNLIGNAIKFTDDGDVKVVCRYDSTRSELIIEVIDTGIGIDFEDQQVLFEPFTQADSTATRSFGGTGLGLTICRRLARALGGDISVRSVPGKGSTFTVRFQTKAIGRLTKPNLNMTNESETTPGEIKLSCTVLIVDDRRDIRYLAQHFIEKAGGHVVTATHGREAVEFVSNPNSPHVDAIVMDMQMPVMDGYAATSELRRQGCTLPIIALTANAMKSDRDECLAAGCTEYTTKPLDRHTLIEMIHRLVKGAPATPSTKPRHSTGPGSD